MRLRYLTPFAFLALLPLGGWLGGAWTFIGAAAIPLTLVGLDDLLGQEGPQALAPKSSSSRWLPRVYIVLQLAVTIWAAEEIARGGASLLEATGLALSAGATTGVFGFVAAHEMIHSRDRGERALGLALLGSVFYMHFRIAHVHGHHRNAATFDDPASARFGEGLYSFMARSVPGQFREAWAFEKRRLERLGCPILRPANRMIAYTAIETALAITIGLASLPAFAFLLAVALVAITLLESFNYVAHYGLSRRVDARGRVERLGPGHSWNSGRRMNNAALFNMGRHSDHHRHMTQTYERLEPLPESAELPSGYASALLLATVPPLWRRVMNPRARAVMGLR